MSSRGEELKEKGNVLFQKKDYAGAIKCYSKAIDHCGQAVYYSNRSNCHFELGDYESCIQDATECLTLLEQQPGEDGASSSTLRYKNLWRMARASYYLDPSKGVSSQLHELADCQDKTYSKVARRMMQQIQTLPSSSAPEPIFFRASVQDSPYGEYFPLGDDDAASALAAGVEGRVPVKDLPKELFIKDVLEQQLMQDPTTPAIVSVLFSGVGDARHVYATLMDLHQQMNKLSNQEKKRMRFHLTMNDIKEAALARNVLVLLAIERLGKCQSSYASVVTDEDARKWAVLLHYLYLGYTMPPGAYGSLCEILDEILSYTSRDEFSREYPHLQFGTADDWKRVRRVWQYWRQEGTDNFDFPSLELVLGELFLPLVGNDAEAWFEELSDSHRRNYPSNQKNLDEYRKVSLAEKRAAMVESLQGQDDSALPQELQEYVQSATSTEERLSLIRKYIEECPDSCFIQQNPFDCQGIFLDTAFLAGTHTFIPPRQGLDDHSAFEAIRQHWKEKPGTKMPLSLLRSANAAIAENWHVNPTFYDPYFYCTPRAKASHHFNPMEDFCKSFFKDAARHMTEQPTTPDRGDDLSLFNVTSLFFWNVAFALSQLLEHDGLAIEVRVGPVNSLARAIRFDEAETRIGKGWPCKYHRILTSNVPDYTSMLPIMLDVMPMLHESTSKIDTHLESYNLFTCELWDDYEHFLYSSTAIPKMKDVEAILGFHLRSDACVWVQHYWTWSNSNKRVSREVLTTWLRRLYVQIVLPAKRDARAPVREECTNTIATFLSVCDFLIQVRRIPAHWVVSAIDGILQGGGRKFKVLSRPPSTFPKRFEPLKKAETINLTSFSLELEMQLALWTQKNGPGPLSTVKLTSQSGDVRRYSLTRCFMENDEDCYGCGGHPNARCLGLVLEKNAPPSATPFEEMFHRMMGGRSIRADLLADGASDYFVLSCVEFVNDWKDASKQTITFLVSSTVYEKYQSYYLSVFRTDSWERVRNEWGRKAPLRLRDAKCIG